MTGDRMDFEAMVPGAFRALMVSALTEAGRHGLAGNHHFYITYATAHHGVRMPDSLRAQYPETITIVLQHEFWDLEVGDEGFSVALAFNGVTHQLGVPFDAVIGFADPSVHFAVQFQAPRAGRKDAPASGPRVAAQAQAGGGAPGGKPGEVVALDAFRKK